MYGSNGSNVWPLIPLIGSLYLSVRAGGICGGVGRHIALVSVCLVVVGGAGHRRVSEVGCECVLTVAGHQLCGCQYRS